MGPGFWRPNLAEGTLDKANRMKPGVLNSPGVQESSKEDLWIILDIKKKNYKKLNIYTRSHLPTKTHIH